MASILRSGVGSRIRVMWSDGELGLGRSEGVGRSGREIMGRDGSCARRDEEGPFSVFWICRAVVASFSMHSQLVDLVRVLGEEREARSEDAVAIRHVVGLALRTRPSLLLAGMMLYDPVS